MEFFLPFKIAPFPFPISFRDKILLIGSCFSEEIGKRMKELKTDVLQNPNGILYDPVSISDSLLSYMENKMYKEEDLFEWNGLWHSWKHHSAFSGINSKDVLEKINLSQNAAHQFLKETKFLIITFGTAFNYEIKSNHQSVANCHKAPSSLFEKKLLTADEIIFHILSALKALDSFHPDLKIIFTVSPVKHTKDGVIENNRSKARLIEAVHCIIEQRKNAFYFPSYELVTDVLRDYRFYKNDLVHPNEEAVNFVFEKFCDSVLDDEAKNICEEIKIIMKAVHHKPFFREGEQHKKFVAVQIKNISNIERRYPFIDFSKEKKYFNSQL
ncbi:MAG: GSCFA domain-containing protein [Ginsengibacter sp.]